MVRTLLAQLPTSLRSIAHKLSNDLPSARIYLVGGAVRDMLLERPTKDYDLVVGGLKVDKLEHWLAMHGQVNLVGKTFGVFKWQPAGWAGEAIDVALPRTEHASLGTGQYRDFHIQSRPELPIEDDLKRRDFTVNALALELTSGELIDPARGQADLNKKLMRTVGPADVRLKEDLSRVLRCLRQACQLNFAVEPATWEAVQTLAHKAGSGRRASHWLVPREVVARELLKSLKANGPRALELFDQSGLLSELLPEVKAMQGVPQPEEFHSEGDVFEHTKLALEAPRSPEWREFFGPSQPSLNVSLAIILHDIGKPLTLKLPERDGVNRIRTDGHDVTGAALVPDICTRLKLTSYVDPEAGQINVTTLTWLAQHHMLLAHGSPDVLKPSTIYRYFWEDFGRGLELQQLIFSDMHATRPQDGRQLTDRLVELRQRIDEVGRGLKAGKLESYLSGQEIMAAFHLKPGPEVGRLIKLLAEAQLEGTVKSKRQAQAWLKRNL